MQLGSQKISVAVVGAVFALSAATVWLIPTKFIPYWLAGLGIATGMLTYVFLGSLLVALLAWFVTITCLHEEFARLILPSFFNPTIPRVLLATIVLLFVAMVAVGRIRIRWALPSSALMAAILAYFTISAVLSGFQTVAVASVHYRLIGGYWFPFIVFGLFVHAVRTDQDVRRILIFFFAIGLYLTFIGWAERFELWAVVWPRFIGDPTKGIHWGRVRGPFLASPVMGLAIVYVFVNNLVLARMSGPIFRVVCRLASLATLPVVFWTQTRSVWLALAVAGLLYVGLLRRGLSRVVWLSLISAIVITAATVNWRSITSTRREVGGVTSLEPIYVRLGLALITWDMFKEAPAFGSGFGHFRDHAIRHAHNPSSPYYAFASSAMEHNNFLSIVAECGLVGLVLYVWLLIALLRASIRLYRRLPPLGAGGELISRDVIVLYWTLYANFFIDGMCRETSVSPFANSLFFGLSGVVLALDYLLGPEPLFETPSPETKTLAGARPRTSISPSPA